MFRQWDAQCGGGLRRKAVVGQLHEVTDLLQEPQPEATTRKRLFKVAAELAELAGWMSYDVGLQPTAQKYFVLALHAAKEAGDKPLGSYVLSSMSRQMIHLGRPDDALELIHLAQYGSRDCASPRTQSMLYAMEARAYANMGQPGKCKRAVRMAEDTFADVDEWDEPGPRLDPLLLRGRAVRRELALLPRPRLRRRPQPHLRLHGRAADAGGRRPLRQGRRAPALVRAQPHRHGHRAPAPARARAEHGAGRGRPCRSAKKVRSERVNTRIRKTVDTAVRDFGDLAEVIDLTDQLAVDLPETAEAV